MEDDELVSIYSNGTSINAAVLNNKTSIWIEEIGYETFEISIDKSQTEQLINSLQTFLIKLKS
jgi:hypothetical protein